MKLNFSLELFHYKKPSYTLINNITIMNYLRKIDIFGEKVKIFINKEEAVSTSLGGSFTIALIILCITFTWIIGKDIIYKQSPYLNKESLINEFYPSITLNRTSFPFAVFVTDYDGVPVSNDRLFQVVLTYYEYAVHSDGYYYVRSKTNVEVEPCGLKHFPSIDTDQFNKSNLGIYQCLKEENLELVGYWTEEYFKYLEVRLQACNGIDCLPLDDTINYIKENRISFNIIYLEPFLQNTNFDNPLQYAVTLKYIYAQSLLAKAVTFGLDINYLHTDYGLINNDFHTSDFFSLGIINPTDPVDIDVGTHTLVTFEIFSSNKYTNLYRSYIKAPDILAAVGGLMGVGQVIFAHLNILFSRLNRNLNVINQVYNLDNPIDNKKGVIQKAEANKLAPSESLIQLKHKRKTHIFDQTLQRYVIPNDEEGETIPYSKKVENIKKVFQQRGDLKFNVKETLYYIFCRKCKMFKINDRTKNKVIKYEKGEKFVKVYYDLINIIKRLEELELLKKVIFTENQHRLFDLLRQLTTNERVCDEKLKDIEEDLKNIYDMRDKSIVDGNLYYLLDY
jgi:hypothetical protein